MLARIISQFLDVSEQGAQHLLELIKREGRFSSPQKGKLTPKGEPVELDPKQIKTHADLVSFLQVTGQGNWFKDHDRSKFPADGAKSLDAFYFTAFQALGLTEVKEFDEKKWGKPHASVVPGSSDPQVKARAQTLKAQLESGLIPAGKQIFGLGANRALGVGVTPGCEDAAIAELQERKEPLTEMSMVTLRTQQMLAELKDTQVEYIGVNTVSGVVTRGAGCATTGTTASTLKGLIESAKNFSELKKPICINIVSKQPFVERQRRDFEGVFGEGYAIVGTGMALTEKELKEHEKGITVCLGEVARLININYQRANLQLLAKQTLTAEELVELQAFHTPTKTEKSALQTFSLVAAKPASAAEEFKAEVTHQVSASH